MKAGTLVVLLCALAAAMSLLGCDEGGTPSNFPADSAGGPKDAATPDHDAPAPDTGPTPIDAGDDISTPDAGADSGEFDSGGDAGWDARGFDMGVIPNCGPSPTGRGGDMCAVPGGPYMMGCNEAVDNECTDAEKPYHEVTVPDFNIDKFEVTAAEYRRCVTEGGCVAVHTLDGCNYAVSGKEDHPINFNCIYVAIGSEPEPQMAYCKWVGNVYEWVEDWWHNTYTGAPSDGSAWVIPAHTSRVSRGGSWARGYAYALRASSRVSGDPMFMDWGYGFRCAMSQ